MATGLSDKIPQMRRRSSKRLLPPKMAEVRLILLGESWSTRCEIANIIMGTVAFKTEENPNFSCKHTTTIQKTKVVLINTPDLLFLKMPEERLKEHIDHCVRLSDPGPHLFLLVVQMESFMEEKKKSFYKILELFSDQSFNHSLVLKLKLTQRVPITNEPLEELIRRCQKNSHILDYKNINGLLNTIGDILEMNNEKHLKV
uniref:AIG1-type G domain-containing protein n=1 Tax=Cyprinodon variegatus TaxID=28743 RepID=A0A3Q2DAZ3_CYPVA